MLVVRNVRDEPIASKRNLPLLLAELIADEISRTPRREFPEPKSRQAIVKPLLVASAVRHGQLAERVFRKPNSHAIPPNGDNNGHAEPARISRLPSLCDNIFAIAMSYQNITTSLH